MLSPRPLPPPENRYLTPQDAVLVDANEALGAGGTTGKRNKTRQKFSHSNGNSADVALTNVCSGVTKETENYVEECLLEGRKKLEL